MPATAELVALLDMDGTLCNLDEAMARALEMLRDPSEPPLAVGPGHEYPPHIKARRRLIKLQPDWWFNLRPHPPGFQVVEILRELGYSLMVLTKGPSVHSTSAWTQKKDWCTKHIPDALVTITEDKGLMYGKILVDDWPPYVLRWLEWRPRGQVIMPAWPWNEDFTHPNVVRYTGENLDEVREALERMAESVRGS